MQKSTRMTEQASADAINADDGISTHGEKETLDDTPSQHHINNTTGWCIHIVSAEYGPCEDQRLLTGEWTLDTTSHIPHTRNVLPFIMALLKAQQIREQSAETGSVLQDTTVARPSNSDCQTEAGILCMNTLTHGMKRASILVLDTLQWSMNAVFGDPCVGTSKRLYLQYRIWEGTQEDKHAPESTPVISLSFAEHENIILPTRHVVHDVPLTNDTQGTATVINNDLTESSEHTLWTLSSSTTETALPMILPYLSVPERVHCQLVSKLWRSVIRSWGVATTIDNNDRTTFPTLSRPIVCGLLSHSYSSLQALYLSGFASLEQSDLHPAIPQLHKLRSLDISRCIQLDDTTLELVARHCHESLQVLYVKGLTLVTNRGIQAIASSCRRLSVLDISHLDITDDAGLSIGNHLQQLRALYMRDNFRLTNLSMDVITSQCTRLEQLTMWGCIKVTNLAFVGGINENGSMGNQNNLTTLNLWGCYSLSDSIAEAFVGMKSLRTMIVSECHRLGDAFVVREETDIQWHDPLSHCVFRCHWSR
jgi:hypothetical protein